MTAIILGRRALLAGATALAVAPGIGFAAFASPVEAIERLNQSLLTVMRQGKTTPFATRVRELTPAIDGALDLPDILRLSVGPSWATLTSAQRSALLNVFRQYTVATFVENFDSYDGQQITVSPTPRVLGDGVEVVHTQIVPRSGRTGHTIDYVMRQTPDGGWHASDVLADGTISRVAVMRSDFAAMLAKGGAPALEASLQEKTAALRNG